MKKKIISNVFSLALLILLGWAAQASRTSMLSFFYFSLSLALFVLVYYLFNRKIHQLSQAEDNFQDLYNHAPCGYHSLDQDGKIVAINDTELNWLGYSRDEVVGKLKITDLLSPESRAIFWEEFPRFLKSGCVKDLEFQFLRKDGTILPAIINATVIRDAAGNFVTTRGTLFDITKRKQALEALRKSEQRFRLAVDNIPDVFVIYDQQRRLQFVNAEGIRQSGLCEEALLGKTDEELFPPEITQGYLPSLQRAVETRTSQTTECTMTLATIGTKTIVVNYVPLLDERGKISSILGITHDLTERKHKEEQLRLLESVVVNTNDAVVITEAELSDKLASRIIYANPGFTRMTGYSLEDVMGKTLHILQGPKTNRATLNQIRLALQRWQPIQVDLINYRKDGSEFWIDLSIAPVANEKGVFTHWVSVQRDISDRKLAEAQLQQSEQKFRQLAENIHEVFWMSNRDASEILYVSPAYERIWGRRCESLYANPKSFLDAVHPDDKQNVLASIEQNATGTFDIEYRVVQPNNSVRWVRDRSFPIQNESGEIYRRAGIAQDITSQKQAEAILRQVNEELEIRVQERTAQLQQANVRLQQELCERKRVEQALRESEERWQLAIQGSNDGIWDLNVKTKEAFYSARWKEMLGYKDDEITNHMDEWVKRVHPDDLERVMQVYKDHLGKKTPFYTHEHRLLCKNGTYKWILTRAQARWDEQGIPVRLTGSHTDISDAYRQAEQRQQAQEALRDSEERFRSAFDYASIGMALVALDGHWLKVNHSLCEIVGYSEQELLATTVQAITHPDDLDTDLDHLNRMLSDEISSYQMEKRYFHKLGHVVWILLSGSLVRDRESQPVYFIAQIQDITAGKQAEEARRETEERLQAILDNATAVISLKDTEGRFILINRQLETLFHKPKEQILGKNYYDFFPKEMADTFYANDRRVIEAGIALEFEEMAPHDDKIHPYISIKFPLRDANGIPYAVCSISTDITERKIAEETLRKQACIFENLYDGIILTDLEGRIIDWNPAAERIFGYTKAEVLGKTPGILHKPEDSAVLTHKIIKGMLKVGRWSGEINFIRKDGKKGVCETVVVPLHNEQGQAIAAIGVNSDISDVYDELRLRQQAEEERAKLIAILEATPDIVATATIDEQIEYLNSAARKVFGFGENEDCANFSILKSHPEWAYQLIRNEGIPKAIRDGVWVGETAFLSQDGQSIPVSQLIIAHKSTDGSVKLLSTVARDITQQKKIAATLLEAERRWRSLLENVRLVVVGLDHNGKVEYANPCFLDLVGYTKAEVLGKDWFETFLPQHQRHRVQNNFLELLEQEFYTHDQNIILTKSGEERVIAWNNTLLQDLQGYVIGTLSIGEDITERQVIERMKDEFISVVSHELRTPLTSIHGALNLLSSGLVNTQSDKGRRVIEIAAESAERLVRLVNDILELERLESGKISLSKQLCNAAELIEKATDMMQVMGTRAGITLSVSSLAIQLNVDSDRIIQVLTNLIGNAIKFSARGSTVWLSVELVTGNWGLGAGNSSEFVLPFARLASLTVLSSELESSTQHSSSLSLISNPTVLFTVKDQGRGIPIDKIESIFERFHQVDASDSRKKGGTGLGLAICRSIVQQHGGRIWVESTLGEGSTFYFTLPVTEGING